MSRLLTDVKVLNIELPAVKTGCGFTSLLARMYQVVFASVGRAAEDSLTPAVPDTAATELPS